MSIRTRREQRKKRAELPLETDWLWSCLPATPLKEIVLSLAFSQEPQTELSARFWADEQVFKADLYRALFLHLSLKGLNAQVHWDAFDEDLRDAREGGRLLVIRQLSGLVPHAV